MRQIKLFYYLFRWYLAYMAEIRLIDNNLLEGMPFNELRKLALERQKYKSRTLLYSRKIEALRDKKIPSWKVKQAVFCILAGAAFAAAVWLLNVIFA